jgi:non-ribosomal peptide synthetase component F
VVEPYPYESRTVKFDLQLEAIEAPGEIILLLNYPTALFKRTSAETIAGHYMEILEQIMANIEVNIRDISISHTLTAANTKVLQQENISFDF